MPAFSSAPRFALPPPMPGTIERSSLISALMKFARRSSFTADVAPMLKGILFGSGPRVSNRREDGRVPRVLARFAVRVLSNNSNERGGRGRGLSAGLF